MANNKRFFPIFEQDGEPSTPPAPRKMKPPPKRVRQETASPPQAPLAIEAPPTPAPRPSPTNVRLDEIELTLRKYLIRMDAIVGRFDELRNMFEDWDFTFLHKRMDAVDTLTKKDDAFDRLQMVLGTTNLEVDAVSLELDVLVSRVATLIDRPAPLVAPAPAAAPDPRMLEAITALSKKVDCLLTRPAPAAPTATAPAPKSQHLAALTKQVTAVSQQLTALTARHSTTAAAPTKKPVPPAATTAKPARAAATVIAWNDHRTSLGTCVVLPRGSIQFFCDETLCKCNEGA
jgi:hypothetical protein